MAVGAAAVSNVILNLYLAPKLGSNGAAISMTASLVFQFIVYIGGLRTIASPVRSLQFATLFTLLGAGSIVAARAMTASWWIALPISIAFFALVSAIYPPLRAILLSITDSSVNPLAIGSTKGTATDDSR